ncbi:hypothetical protein Dimus_010160 [Dionaea muscipula]
MDVGERQPLWVPSTHRPSTVVGEFQRQRRWSTINGDGDFLHRRPSPPSSSSILADFLAEFLTAAPRLPRRRWSNHLPLKPPSLEEDEEAIDGRRRWYKWSAMVQVADDGAGGRRWLRMMAWWRQWRW